MTAITIAIMANDAAKQTGRRDAAKGPAFADGKYTRSRRPMIRLTKNAITQPRTRGKNAAHTAPTAASTCWEYITPSAARNAKNAARARRVAERRTLGCLSSMVPFGILHRRIRPYERAIETPLGRRHRPAHPSLAPPRTMVTQRGPAAEHRCRTATFSHALSRNAADRDQLRRS